MSAVPGNIVVQLHDGTPVRIRPVLPSDAERVRRGYRDMSATARHMRFFVAGEEMSEAQARYFTEIDQVNHVALCAVAPTEAERGYGIARFVRDADRNDVAEFAIAVIDEMQRRGLGTVLLAALYLRAKSAGLRLLHAEFMASNPVMPRWLPKLNASIASTNDPSFRTINWPISAPLAATSATAQHFAEWVERLSKLVM
jgi:GNAT superfamily N-acetyltransferase